jgi:hypothetical protein
MSRSKRRAAGVNSSSLAADGVATNGHATQNGGGPQVISDEIPESVRTHLHSVTNEMALNEVLFRRQLIQMYNDPRRNIESECGYVQTETLDALTYKKQYERDPIAARVVDIYPKECWQVSPLVKETQGIDEEDQTPFEIALEEVAASIAGTSLYVGQEEEGNALWEYLKRVDKLSGIGHYGVLLIGTDDNAKGDLSQPLELNPDGFPTANRKLLYLRALDESLAKIATLDTDPASPRYCQPTAYDLILTRPVMVPGQLAQSVSQQGTRVHWTRVLHVADNLESSEIYGMPRMRPVFNRLYDLHKLYSGSAEMYWKGAFPGLSFEVQPSLVGKTKPLSDPQKRAFKDMLENYWAGLDRALMSGNMQAKTLAPTVVDPSEQIDKQVEALCIYIGCPKRIFMGSERGELSSNQDTRAWYARCKDRQITYLTPRLIVPFIDRLIQIGIVPAPEEYFVEWPDVSSVTELEQAQILLARTQSYAAYVGGNVESFIAPKDYLVREANFDEDTADEMLGNASEGAMELETRMQEAQPEPEPGPVQFAPDGTPIGPDAKPLGPKMAPKPAPTAA